MTVADDYTRLRASDRAALVAELDAEAATLEDAFRRIVRARHAAYVLGAAVAKGDDMTKAERDEYPFTERAYGDAIADLPFDITNKEQDDD